MQNSHVHDDVLFYLGVSVKTFSVFFFLSFILFADLWPCISGVGVCVYSHISIWKKASVGDIGEPLMETLFLNLKTALM